jgi:hypothetical protein
METTNVKKSELKLDKTSKILFAKVQGAFKPDDATEFVMAYTKNVAEINPKEYELHFDSTQLKVSTQEMVPMLSACFEMYKKDEFRKIVFNCGTNATLKLQINRVGKTVGLLNYELV